MSYAELAGAAGKEEGLPATLAHDRPRAVMRGPGQRLLRTHRHVDVSLLVTSGAPDEK